MFFAWKKLNLQSRSQVVPGLQALLTWCVRLTGQLVRLCKQQANSKCQTCNPTLFSLSIINSLTSTYHLGDTYKCALSDIFVEIWPVACICNLLLTVICTVGLLIVTTWRSLTYHWLITLRSSTDCLSSMSHFRLSSSINCTVYTENVFWYLYHSNLFVFSVVQAALWTALVCTCMFSSPAVSQWSYQLCFSWCPSTCWTAVTQHLRMHHRIKCQQLHRKFS